MAWLETDARFCVYLKHMAKPEVLRSGEIFQFRSLAKGIQVNMVNVIGIIPTLSARAYFLGLFLAIFIKTMANDVVKRDLAEVILPAAETMLTK